jgi:uncharacterized phage protein gp47/JayE
MPDFVGNFGEVLRRGIRVLTQFTNIRQMSPGGKARSILETHAKEMENASILMDGNLQKAFLPTAQGQFLEHFGATVGLEKYGRRNAEASALDRVFRFYTRHGETFGEINGGEGFTIPAGTRITSPAAVSVEASTLYGDIESPDSVGDRSIHYSLTSPVSCSADKKEVFFAAKALSPGRAGNLAAPNMIRSHEFKEYSLYLTNLLLVTNDKPLLNGSDDEGEASYRYRISREITAAEQANNAAIQKAALAVPGVAAVVILPWEDGAGRFNCYIKSVSANVSDKTVSDVQRAIDETTAEGCVGYARKPYEVGVEIDSTIFFRASHTREERDEIRTSLSIAAVRYLNSLDLGQPLILSDMASFLKRVDGRVREVGSNPSTLFDAVFVYWPARLASGGRRRERSILGTIVVPVHSRIIAETSISSPIRFV